MDEIGPLELDRGRGWVNALDVLCAGQFGLAVVVVRPSLVDAFRAAMGDVPLSLFTSPFFGAFERVSSFRPLGVSPQGKQKSRPGAVRVG